MEYITPLTANVIERGHININFKDSKKIANVALK